MRDFMGIDYRAAARGDRHNRPPLPLDTVHEPSQGHRQDRHRHEQRAQPEAGTLAHVLPNERNAAANECPHGSILGHEEAKLTLPHGRLIDTPFSVQGVRFCHGDETTVGIQRPPALAAV
jgi:hypothetical protein